MGKLSGRLGGLKVPLLSLFSEPVHMCVSGSGRDQT